MSWIVAENESGGFHGILFDYLRSYARAGQSVKLVSETEKVLTTFKDHFDLLNFECENKLDLNILHKCKAKDKVDVVFAQAVLEHVCRPSIVIENFCNMVKVDGHIILHTHNRHMEHHAFPIDCCRFFKDFFVDLCKYLPVELMEYHEWDRHIAVCYKRI